MHEKKLAAEKQRTIEVEAEANEKIRILEMETSFQDYEAKTNRDEKQKIEDQLEEAKQRYGDLVRSKQY